MQVQLSEFKEQSATHAVSLGPNCSTAFNLRRFYNFGDAFPFDWWITPHKGLIDTLQRLDVNYLYDQANLEFTDGRGSVRHRDLGILFHHEFNRNWSEPGNPVWEESIKSTAKPIERTGYLLSKFRELNRPENRIFFFREIGSISEIDEIETELAKSFDLAEWCLVTVPLVRAPGHGWQGDPNIWNDVLNNVGLTLDTTNHKPFTDKTNPDTDSRQVHV